MKHDGTNGASAGHRLVLEALDGAGHVSQRSLAESVGMAASRVNRIIRSLLAEGRLRVVDEAVRPYAYAVTESGRTYLQTLSYDHYAEVVERFRQAQDRILTRLRRAREAGVERVVFYGAGEVMEVVRPLAESLGMRVVGVVDDDPRKRGRRGDVDVLPPECIVAARPDAVVITTFRHASEIRSRLGAGPAAGVTVVEL